MLLINTLTTNHFWTLPSQILSFQIKPFQYCDVVLNTCHAQMEIQKCLLSWSFYSIFSPLSYLHGFSPLYWMSWGWYNFKVNIIWKKFSSIKSHRIALLKVENLKICLVYHWDINIWKFIISFRKDINRWIISKHDLDIDRLICN